MQVSKDVLWKGIIESLVEDYMAFSSLILWTKLTFPASLNS
jgi:hypothetical protein